MYCDPTTNRFRQHPLDYIESLEASIREALAKAGPDVAPWVKGISVDRTGSTPVFVNDRGYRYRNWCNHRRSFYGCDEQWYVDHGHKY